MATFLLLELPTFQIHQALEILEGHAARIVACLFEQLGGPFPGVTMGSYIPSQGTGKQELGCL